MTQSHRAREMTPTRRALLAAGVATLAVSLVLSIAPVIAANGNGNSGSNGNSGGGNGGGNGGTVKVHDATTGQETDPNDNDPHVCTFWVAFYASEPFETGTWQLLSWAPTGDGSTVASGAYDTTGDGLDATETLSPDPGHFRFEWAAAGSNTSKNKTLWVDDCGTDEETPPFEEETPPSDEETPPFDEETPPSDEETPPSDEETPPSQEVVSPSDEETPPSFEETPATDEETPPSDEETPATDEEVPPSEDVTPPSDEETPPSDGETPPVDEEVPPSEDVTPPSEEEAPASPEEGEGDVLPGIPAPRDLGTAPEADVAAGGATTLPDTAVSLESSGVLAALGLLLIVAAHAGTRRRPVLG